MGDEQLKKVSEIMAQTLGIRQEDRMVHLASSMIEELVQIESVERELMKLKFSSLDEFVIAHTNEYRIEKSGSLVLAKDRFTKQVVAEVN